MLRAPSHKRTCMLRYVNDIYAIPAICQRYECNMTQRYQNAKDRVDLMCTQHTLLIYVADMPRYGSDKIGYGRDISDMQTMWQKYDSIRQKLDETPISMHMNWRRQAGARRPRKRVHTQKRTRVKGPPQCHQSPWNTAIFPTPTWIVSPSGPTSSKAARYAQMAEPGLLSLS